MDIDRFKGGIIFNWMNKNEIYNKYNGLGKKQNVQSYIDKLHVDYIATRKGVDKSANTHGLFGNILGTDNVEILELEDIKKYIQGKSNENIDIFKTVISLREEDAMQYGFLNQKAWKNLLQERTFEIAKAFKIPINDMEWVAAFHAKKGQPHCHLVVWNKNQDLSVKRKPYIFYNDMRKVIAKGVYKEELEAEYNVKDISKKELGKLSQKEFEKLKENMKELYNNKELVIRAIETEKTENIINETLDNMKIGQKLYIANKTDPDNYTEILKRDETNYEFKNIGDKAILYKDNTYLEAVSFLSKFNKLIVIEDKKSLEKFIRDVKNEEKSIDDELKEIMPSSFNIPILTSEIKNENLEQIVNKIAKLEKVSDSFKKGYIYKYQEPECKRIINEISTLLINSNKECKEKFNNYVNTCIRIDKILQKVNTYKDYENIKNKAKTEMIRKVGNQLLKTIKESKKENYIKKSQEWKEQREYWLKKKQEYEENQGKYEARQELYEKQLQEINIRNLAKDVYRILAEENISKNQTLKRITKTFGDLSKREIKEIMRKNKDAGFDWYHEM